MGHFSANRKEIETAIRKAKDRLVTPDKYPQRCNCCKRYTDRFVGENRPTCSDGKHKGVKGFPLVAPFNRDMPCCEQYYG